MVEWREPTEDERRFVKWKLLNPFNTVNILHILGSVVMGLFYIGILTVGMDLGEGRESEKLMIAVMLLLVVFLPFCKYIFKVIRYSRKKYQVYTIRYMNAVESGFDRQIVLSPKEYEILEPGYMIICIKYESKKSGFISYIYNY